MVAPAVRRDVDRVGQGGLRVGVELGVADRHVLSCLALDHLGGLEQGAVGGPLHLTSQGGLQLPRQLGLLVLLLGRGRRGRSNGVSALVAAVTVVVAGVVGSVVSCSGIVHLLGAQKLCAHPEVAVVELSDAALDA